MLTVKSFGKTAGGQNVDLITIENKSGNKVEILSLGTIIYGIKLKMPDGNFRDVVLGYDKVSDYETYDAYFGATIGRCANRIGPCDDTGLPGFVLNGKKYYLADNSGPSIHLHGGNVGFNSKVFDYTLGDDYVDFECFSPDGEENYPGNLKLKVRIKFNDSNCLSFTYEAESDADTVCNLTNHSYFNLAGHESGTAMTHSAKIAAEYVTEVDSNITPNGNLLPVAGTPLDFREFNVIGERIGEAYKQLEMCGGYDHNFVLGEPDVMKLAAVLESPSGDISMTVMTDRPCVQFYVSNSLTERKGKDGAVYDYRGAVCFETQNYPNAINRPMFPSVVLKAGEKMTSTSKYLFEIR